MQHQAPAFIDDPHAPEGVPPMLGLRWYGHRRLVHRKRARTLRKRGVPLRVVAPGVWAWYETDASFETRKTASKLRGWLRSNSADRLFRNSMAAMLCKNFVETEAQIYAFWQSMNPETATGAALDALCRLPVRPAGMTDDEVRSLYTRGYVLTVAEAREKYDLPLGPLAELQEQAKRHMSPPMTLYYFDEAYRLPAEGWPTDKPFETGPFPLGVLHIKPEGEE